MEEKHIYKFEVYLRLSSFEEAKKVFDSIGTSMAELTGHPFVMDADVKIATMTVTSLKKIPAKHLNKIKKMAQEHLKTRLSKHCDTKTLTVKLVGKI